jgi:hypothetical protein
LLHAQQPEDETDQRAAELGSEGLRAARLKHEGDGQMPPAAAEAIVAAFRNAGRREKVARAFKRSLARMLPGVEEEDILITEIRTATDARRLLAQRRLSDAKLNVEYSIRVDAEEEATNATEIISAVTTVDTAALTEETTTELQAVETLEAVTVTALPPPVPTTYELLERTATDGVCPRTCGDTGLSCDDWLRADPYYTCTTLEDAGCDCGGCFCVYDVAAFGVPDHLPPASTAEPSQAADEERDSSVHATGLCVVLLSLPHW